VATTQLDFGRLRKLLLCAGFVNVTTSNFPESRFCSREQVAEIDRHPQESLLVECIKRPSALWAAHHQGV
jgi:hypothetical protein